MTEICPNAEITGVDLSPIFPSSIKPRNCFFKQCNILDGLPFPDNHFDFVYQRLLVAGLTPENWSFVLKELRRVTKPGGWIELVEGTVLVENGGPNTKKKYDWFINALKQRGVDMMIVTNPGLKALLEEAGVVNIHQKTVQVPTYKEGGKLAELFRKDIKSADGFIGQMAARYFGVTQEEFDEVSRKAEKELDGYGCHGNYLFAWGQKM
jgi:ubiquinone/menaquinone biosynthesis C-methylase UbiE